MIQISNLSKSFGQKDLFSAVTFNIEKRERIGLVGRNGSGKTTLFKIISEKESADQGDILIPNGYKLGHLQQHINFNHPTVLEECTSVLSEEEQFDHFKAEKILSGLGFTEEDFYKHPDQFSGGYQIRINLTKVILQQPDILLLDEPTNYLDIISLRWLSSFLQSFKGEVLLITHDRSFMDDVATHIVGIRRGKVKKIKGKTSKYYEQIIQEEEIHEQTRQNVEKKKKELMLFVDRFKAKASKASQAQSKLKQVNKMENVEQLVDEKNMNLKFCYQHCPSKEIFSATNISFSYPNQDLLFKDINFTLAPTECLAIVGKNGKGKSTLLNTLSGEFQPNTGQTKKAPGALISHFGQTNIDRLHPTNTIEQEIFSSNEKLSRTEVRSICGSMMFSASDAEKKIQVLSGGERARVLLGKLIANPSNVLFLDEPTNHLDIESVEILLKGMKDFPGAIILVTHNEMILKSLATRLIIFRKNGAEYFQGSYQDFLEKIGWEDDLPKKEKKEKKPKKKPKDNSFKIKELEQDIQNIESVIDGLEKIIKSKEKELAESGNQKMIQLSQEIDELNGKVDALFNKLTEKTETLTGLL